MDNSNLSGVSVSPSKPAGKSSKLILGVLILAFLLIAIPLTIFLVKQRQEIRKKAVMHKGMYGCGLRVNPVKEEPPTKENNGTYSVTFRIFNVDNPDNSWEFEFLKCVCPEGKGETGGVCLKCERSEETIFLKKVKPGYENVGDESAVERVISVKQPSGELCGSFQIDVNIIGGPGNCYEREGHYGPVWGLWVTNIDCGGQPTPTTVTTLTPTMPITPTLTPPIITATPTPFKTGCYNQCDSDINCTDSLACQERRAGVKLCVNPNCPNEPNCWCPGPTNTPAPPTVTPAPITPITIPPVGTMDNTFLGAIAGLSFVAIALLFAF